MPAAKLSLSQTPQLILAFVSLLLSSAQVLAETDRDVASPVTSLTLLDIEGNSYQPFQNEKTKACVLVFVSTDCPIANAFQPELRSFHQMYAGKGIDCYMIYCAPRMTVAKVTRHINQYEVEMPAVVTDSHKIAKMVGATVTPEAVLVNRSGAVCYRGLINNLYAGFGKKRQQATKHYLHDACDELIKNGTVTTTSTKPIGCFIHFSPSAHQ